MRSCLAALTLLAALPMAGEAGELRASFAVSATVLPRAQLESVRPPALLAVSNEDVARGFVDVAAVYRVQNNDPAGYIMRLAPLTGLTSMIEVTGLASDVVMRDEVVEVTQPAALEARDLILRIRLVLGPGTPAGTYPMPLQVSVAPF